ncbi:Transmembrane protein 163 like protein [Argiope bruennichi]|uniref:Transmembrane protein 163 like protein n=1 Tax=Argiope bruennichi TaxID=94029 RepID=A0A8T0F2V9_ARGBR|nr:Transmembrane protein 163 like protein [Argiope bruennichi]
MGQLTNAPKCATNANAFDIANSFEKEDIPLKINDSLADRKRKEHLRLYVIALCITSADCVLDLLSSFIVIWRYFGSPYRLGSYSREYKACISLGVLFIVAGVGVIIEGIYFLFAKDIPKWYSVLIILAAVGSFVCFLVGFAKYVLGRKLNSEALYLDALNSILSGLFALVIIISDVVYLKNKTMWYLDPLLSIVLSVGMLALGFRTIIMQCRHGEYDPAET